MSPRKTIQLVVSFKKSPGSFPHSLLSTSKLLFVWLNLVVNILIGDQSGVHHSGGDSFPPITFEIHSHVSRVVFEGALKRAGSKVKGKAAILGPLLAHTHRER